ncbi:1-acyl-sn-glycerol-3-phosphate acyltransferase [Sulfurimonas lithotrophica]|mgnify:CR=1 FL=1|uniref:1-acyl-sn-glycerol-3-phosphate acyltransferase n=1 Tax=Sulfurimonas lithotrophica TaxID=2590022 RepID=A0A5P8P3D2_9BACT|nr:lysophospholipid acyltransferase family protein [Sulfurimonas lithotrophica]QFR50204.1 1-acyl-sn-glycerol-3-phosphate acyltransferase [Sulfurimonas lithotrophica]
MRIKCLYSLWALVLFWALIFALLIPAYTVYLIAFLFTKYPQDAFQIFPRYIFKLYFKIVPKINLILDIPDELPMGAVYVATHQSSIDYPILGSFIPKYLSLTNVNVTWIPIASTSAKLIGIRYLNSSDLGAVAKSYEELQKQLNEGRNVIIFPEGTRHQAGEELGKFKKVAFRLALNTSSPIIPIVIEGSGKVLAKGDPCYKTLKQTDVHVKMLKPIDPKNFKGERELLKYTQKLLQDKKDEMCEILYS